MNQIEKLKHFKENEVETDYIKVYDRSLNKKTYKQLQDIKLNDKTLAEILESCREETNKVKKENIRLNKELAELKEKIETIESGLHRRWKNY